MDTPSGFRQPAGKRKGGNKGTRSPHGGARPQLFEDTSTPQAYPGYGYPPNPGMDQSGFMPPPAGYPGQQVLNDPMANMAVQYGQTLAGQGKEYMKENLEKYVSSSKLKYYFAVDTTYVGKKLGLIAFPFTHSDWSIRYNQDEPVAPRYEVNAPDLYIPVMAFVTYILVAGIVLGTQNKFTPEQLGIQASSALVWIIIEVLALMLSLYVMNVSSQLKYLDILAYSGYKYVGMIACLLAGLVFKASGYYAILLYFSISTAFFLVRTLRVQVLPHTDTDGFTRGSKRSLYLILTMSLVQPIFMWWLTSHIMFAR
ncbi:protein YIF1B-B-like isoform X2 [Liolophura sinensis]|uniref:protein YIF1B-B-like isoform X2 n=1 Tax=Liolophura sinensis TaxID=3198878 RepID=UPI0031586213